MTERTIFLNALDKLDPAERAAYLAAACAGDADLRRRVEALLESHTGAGSFLGVPAVEQMPADHVTPSATGETLPRAFAAADDALALLDPPGKTGVLGCLKHYDVVAVIGRGGMGIVLKAFDPTLSRFVAIKLMAPQLALGADARRRFEREARAAAAVTHEHVVAIFEVGEFKNVPYLVMEYVAGVSLQQRIDERGPQEVAEVLRIGMQTALGLAAAHAQGLVHRDIKPDNILLHNGIERVKITDFGLARAVDDVSLTQPGTITGTPAYMAPEQARGEPVDHRSDLFSLGSVLYALCTGRAPFRGDSLPVVLKRISEERPRPVREVNPDTPEWLAAIVAKLHAADPDDRFQSAQEVADLLGGHLAHLREPNRFPQPAIVDLPKAPARPSSGLPFWVWLVILVALVPCCVPPLLALAWLLLGTSSVEQQRLDPVVESKASSEPPDPTGGGRVMQLDNDRRRLQGAWRAINCNDGRWIVGLDDANLIPEALFTVTFSGNRVKTNRPAGLAARLQRRALLTGLDGALEIDSETRPKRLSTKGEGGADGFAGAFRVDNDQLVIWFYREDQRPRDNPFPPELEGAPVELLDRLVIWTFRRAAPK